MSSECSILASGDDYEGLMARVMEFENIQWTKSARSADAIKKASLSNYGWAVPRMAKYLLQIEKESLVEFCEEETASFLENIENKNPLMVRMAKKVGVILATVEIAKEALKINLDRPLEILFYLVSWLIVDLPIHTRTQRLTIHAAIANVHPAEAPILPALEACPYLKFPAASTYRALQEMGLCMVTVFFAVQEIFFCSTTGAFHLNDVLVSVDVYQEGILPAGVA